MKAMIVHFNPFVDWFFFLSKSFAYIFLNILFINIGPMYNNDQTCRIQINRSTEKALLVKDWKTPHIYSFQFNCNITVSVKNLLIRCVVLFLFSLLLLWWCSTNHISLCYIYFCYICCIQQRRYILFMQMGQVNEISTWNLFENFKLKTQRELQNVRRQKTASCSFFLFFCFVSYIN